MTVNPDEESFLQLSSTPKPRSTIRRHYLKWRNSNRIPIRCDNEECQFHRNPLIWNGSTLGLILDHISGNAKDNTPSNLRLLCPNCDSQLHTKGGGNKNRIRKVSEIAYQMVEKDGTVSAKVLLEGVQLKASVGEPSPALAENV